MKLVPVLFADVLPAVDFVNSLRIPHEVVSMFPLDAVLYVVLRVSDQHAKHVDTLKAKFDETHTNT